MLVRLAPDGSGRIETVLPMPGSDVVLGRGTTATMPLIDPSVSREHARISLVGGRWQALTLNPANPIRVAGHAVERIELRPGTEFDVGAVRLRFELDDPRQTSTVLVDGAQATAVIDQVRAARSAMGAAPQSGQSAPPHPTSAAPPAPPRDRAPPPETEAIATTKSARPAAPETRPESALKQPRMWPAVLLLVALLSAAGATAFVFREQLLDLLPEDLRARFRAELGEGSDTNDPDAGPDGTARGIADDPNGALGGWRPTGDYDCSSLQRPLVGEDALGKVLALKGPPSAFSFVVGDDDQTGRVLEYGADGQVVRFEARTYRGGTEGPADADARPLSDARLVANVSPTTDPRCIVDAWGPAHVLLGGVPLLESSASGSVPIAWALERGGVLITEGTRMRLLRIDGEVRAPASVGTTWIGTVGAVREDDETPGDARPLVVVRESAAGGQRVELLPMESRPDSPGLIWTSPGPAADGTVRATDEDEVALYVGDDASAGHPAQLNAVLGLIETNGPGAQLRDFELRFDYADTNHHYTGRLVRTPWRPQD